jgi:ABC-2 type transport system ATP-binding protein
VVDLRKSYGPVRAVDGVSFEMGRGEVFGLLGPNGAGKTTTIEMLEGLLKPDSGSASVLGIDVTRHPGALKERIGVQLQTAALYPNLTVVELIDLFGSFYSKRRTTRDLIDELGLAEPELIFLDEPTTGLDPQGRRSLWEHIAALREQGRTVLLTTHYMEEAERLCDRVAIMDHGQILEMGTVSELVTRHFRERTVRFATRPELTDERLSELNGVKRVAHESDETVLYTAEVPQTVGALLKLGDELALEGLDLAVRRPTLEDVFIELTGRALRD